VESVQEQVDPDPQDEKELLAQISNILDSQEWKERQAVYHGWFTSDVFGIGAMAVIFQELIKTTAMKTLLKKHPDDYLLNLTKLLKQVRSISGKNDDEKNRRKVLAQEIFNHLKSKEGGGKVNGEVFNYMLMINIDNADEFQIL